jgi:hypothetical protein
MNMQGAMALLVVRQELHRLHKKVIALAVNLHYNLASSPLNNQVTDTPSDLANPTNSQSTTRRRWFSI